MQTGEDKIPAELQHLLHTSVQYLKEAILITEAEPFDEPGPRIVWANAALYRLTGYSPEEVIGRNPRMLQGPLTDRDALDRIRHALERWHSVRVETVNYRKDGSPYWVEFEIVPVADETGWYTHWVSILRDVSERKAMEEQLRQLAHYDELTHLPKRQLLEDRLRQAMGQAARDQKKVGIVFIDLDGFNEVNDNHGHHIGDQLLTDLATRIKTGMREADTLARVGGDEFVALIPQLESRDEILPVLERILIATSSVFTIEEIDVRVSASLGVSFYPQVPEVSITQLIDQADRAMYEAKAAGKNQFRFSHIGGY